MVVGKIVIRKEKYYCIFQGVYIQFPVVISFKPAPREGKSYLAHLAFFPFVSTTFIPKPLSYRTKTIHLDAARKRNCFTLGLTVYADARPMLRAKFENENAARRVLVDLVCWVVWSDCKTVVSETQEVDAMFTQWLASEGNIYMQTSTCKYLHARVRKTQVCRSWQAKTVN